MCFYFCTSRLQFYFKLIILKIVINKNILDKGIIMNQTTLNNYMRELNEDLNVNNNKISKEEWDY